MDANKTLMPVNMSGETMEVVTWGTRGSGSVTLYGQPSIYGSNTTAIEIRSKCLPPDCVLLVDGGFGAAACNFSYVEAGKKPKKVFWLYTHYHHDHTTGALLMPWWYDKTVEKHVFGPLTRKGRGPANVFDRLMDDDFWPVSWRSVSSAFKTNTLEEPAAEILLVHPRGGIGKMTLAAYENALAKGNQLSIGGNKYHHDEMLVIRMWRTAHKEETVSYRFEERPTGKVFTFLTDHETTASMPLDLVAHARGSDLLLIDAQYTTPMYEKMTGGWGHATPNYAVKVATAAGVGRMVLTHHDPKARNEFLEAEILGEAQRTLEWFGAEGHTHKMLGVLKVTLGKDYEILTV